MTLTAFAAPHTSDDQGLAAGSTSLMVQTDGDVSYIERSWNGQQSAVTEETKTKSSGEYTVVTGNTTSFADGVWYVVNSNVAVSDRITVTGTANLILCDGATLTAEKGIQVAEGNTLNIFGQKQDTGALIAAGETGQSDYLHKAGIGGGRTQWDSNNYINCGTITIHGGNVTASGGGNSDLGGAGIGGAVFNGHGGTVTVYGGAVTATGRYGAAGIGGGSQQTTGSDYGHGGAVTVYGGTVTATGGSEAAGIGGGRAGRGGTVTVNGGAVNATGGANAVGIGGGWGNGVQDTVTINGGTVNATGGANSFGIGLGNGNYPLNLVLNNGVTMQGSEDGNTWPTKYTGTYTTGASTGRTYTPMKYMRTTPPVFYQAWDESGQTVEDAPVGCTNYSVLNNSSTEWGDSDGETWYVAMGDGDVAIDDRITVTGTVHLILCDGATLTAEKGITVASGNTLNIYPGSTGDSVEGTGILVAKSYGGGIPNYVYAGIGGYGGFRTLAAGKVVIHGGTVTANAANAAGAAGIGGGPSKAGGAVTIYGGTVNATGGTGAMGIGGGQGSSDHGTLTLGKDVKLYGGTEGSTTLLATGPLNYTGDRYLNMSSRGSSAYTVVLTGGENATPSGGETTQAGLTGAMQAVTYTANTGYFFPTTDSAYGTHDGITVAVSEDKTTITVSGTPTANAEITIPAAMSALAVAKADAKAALATYRSAKADSDYDEDGVTALNAAKTNGDTAIDAATVADTQNAPLDGGAWKAEAAAVAVLDAVKTKAQKDAEALETAKTNAKADLDTLKNSKAEGDYDAEDWATLTKAVTDGKAAIDDATTVDGVATAKSNAETAVNAVKTKTQKLADAKTNAKADLDALLAGKAEADYDADDWATLTQAIADGKSAIDNATTTDAVTAAKSNATDAVNAVKTKTQKLADAKTNATSAVNAVDAADYVEADRQTVTDAKAAALAAIGGATTPEAVSEALETFNNTIAGCTTQAAADLAKAKEDAAAALDELQNGKTQGDYDAEDWTTLTQAIAGGKSAIDDATTTDGINEAKSNATDAVNAVKTKAEKLADAKTNATSAVNAVDAAGYIEADRQTVAGAKAAALAAIGEATTPEAVGAALETFNNAIADCTTQAAADQAAADAVVVKNNALPAAADVTAGDKDAIEAARKAYDALTDAQKAKVPPDALKKLTDAVKALEEAEEKAAETDAAKEAIEGLPDPDKVTKDDEDAINKAREAFEALTPEQQEQVGDELKKKLEDDEEALKEVIDEAAAKAVADKINALPAASDVTADDKDAIEAARTAYDALTDAQKAKVDAEALNKLESAEAAAKDAEIVYTAVRGDGSSWTKGSSEGVTIAFKRNVNDDRTIDSFVGLKVDGVEVPQDSYTAVAGSVVITLSPSYLETLSVGGHELTAVFKDGEGTSKLTVKAAATKAAPTSSSPKTGDAVPVAACLAVIAIAAGALLVARRRLG